MSDTEADLEQQAKERLTGGVILVVLLVLLVPELLTGPHPVLPPVAAPPDQAPLRSYTMDLGESTHAHAGPVAASTAVPQASEPAAVKSAPAAGKSAPAAVNSAPQALARMTPINPARPEAAAPSPAPPRNAATTWTVQLGTFSNRENAARLIAGLKAHGFNASISEATRSGHKLFRVRVGAERDRAAAQKLQGHLRAAGEKGGEIVSR
jgi:cell division septation protein DedD